MALRVHKKIQQRDMEIGRNLGLWTLRWLDRMKPSAQVILPKHTETSLDKAKRLLKSTCLKPHANKQTHQNREVSRNLFLSLRNFRPKLFPPVSMMIIKPLRPTGSTTQFRHHHSAGLCYSPIKPVYATVRLNRFMLQAGLTAFSGRIFCSGLCKDEVVAKIHQWSGPFLDIQSFSLITATNAYQRYLKGKH